MKKAYSVSKIVEYLKELLEDDMFLCGLLVEGEISNFRAHSSGHLYFSLLDASAALRCCMFKPDADGLDFAPRSGDFVRMYGRVAVYKKAGDVQFVAESMEISDASGGKIYQDLEALKHRLDAEGVFANARQIPKYPARIAVVTSREGAAVFDIIDTIRRRNPLVEPVVVPVAVQGEQSPADIARGIEIANEAGDADVLIVGRGGGSAEDLWAFNAEVVARAVHASKIPVISAVGHETDFSLCDFAADLRAATPTAAAELATTPLADMLADLRRRTDAAEAAMRERLRICRSRLAVRRHRLSPQREVARIAAQKSELTRRAMRLDHAMATNLRDAKSTLLAKINILDKISPQTVLNRGFVLATDNGKTIHTGQDLKPGQTIRLQFSDTARDAKIL